MTAGRNGTTAVPSAAKPSAGVHIVAEMSLEYFTGPVYSFRAVCLCIAPDTTIRGSTVGLTSSYPWTL